MVSAASRLCCLEHTPSSLALADRITHHEVPSEGKRSLPFRALVKKNDVERRPCAKSPRWALGGNPHTHRRSRPRRRLRQLLLLADSYRRRSSAPTRVATIEGTAFVAVLVVVVVVVVVVPLFPQLCPSPPVRPLRPPCPAAPRS